MRALVVKLLVEETGTDLAVVASAMQLVDVDPVMAVWDARLSAAALAAGLRVAPSHVG